MSLTPSSPSGKGAGMNRIFDRSEIMKAATDLCDKVEFVEESIQEVVAERDELRAEVERLNAAIEGALEQRDWQIEKVDGYKRQADRHRGKIKTLEAELAEAYGLLEEVVLWTYDVNNELIGRRGHPGIPGWLRLLSILAKRKGAE